MNIVRNLPKIGVIAFLAAGAAIGGMKLFQGEGKSNAATLTIPEYSALAQQGQAAFNANCAQCHGINAVGTDQGPPFIHPVYNPGHHGDQAFLAAVRNGVRQHHWPYGDMPPQPQVSFRDVKAIVQYIRETQLANGIVYQQHRM